MNQKSLIQILEDLLQYCNEITGKEHQLKVVLPDQVIEEYSKKFEPIERIIITDYTMDSTLSKVYCNGGTVELVKESNDL